MMLCPRCQVPARLVNATDSQHILYWCPACRTFMEKQRPAAQPTTTKVATPVA
jgi:Zn-finger nucleic acid-binding protein